MSAPRTWRTVGNSIRSLRKANRLTLKQLSRGCGMSPNAISLIERGQVAPTISTVCKIANALGISPGSLFQKVCTFGPVLERASESMSPIDPADQDLRAAACAMAGGNGAFTEADQPSAADEVAEPGPSRVALTCLSGEIGCEADGHHYVLKPGDRLILYTDSFHCLHNPSGLTSSGVLIMAPYFTKDTQKG